MDIRNPSALAGVPPTVLAFEIQRFDFEEIRCLANTIRKGIFDRADTHPAEREQIERVLFLSSEKSGRDYTAGFKCFKEIQELATVLHEKYERTKDVEDLNVNIFIEEFCLDLSATYGAPFNLLGSLRERHRRTQSLADLERAIQSLQRVVELVEDGNPTKPAILCNIAGYLTMRYDSAGAIEDLDQAIASGERAVRLSNDGDVITSKLCNNLQAAFHRRFEQSGNAEDLDAAIVNGNRAASLTIDEDPEKPSILSNFAECFHSRYNLSHAIEDLQQCAKVLQESIALTPDGNISKPGQLDKLGRIFNVVHMKTGALEDINHAIQSGECAISLADDVFFDRPQWLTTLGRSLFLRFKLASSLEDLDQAIEKTAEAVTLVQNRGSAKSEWFHYLRSYFRIRYQHTGEAIENEYWTVSQAENDKQVELFSESCLGCPSMLYISLVGSEGISSYCDDRHSELGGNMIDQDTKSASGLDGDTLSALQGLAYACQVQFKQNGDVANLEKSIYFYRQALNLLPFPHPNQYTSLNSLANALSTLFDQKGHLGDLEESIKFHREALDLLPISHPLQSSSLNNLASALSTRFDQKGDLKDLEEAIRIHRDALNLRPFPHPDRSSSLNNLACALSTQFEQKGDLEDLEETIRFHREALDLRPLPNPDRSSSLNNLACVLYTHFQQRGNLEDLEESIRCHREALHLTPVNHSGKSILLNNLANALSTQFEQGGVLEDLEESIRLHRQALDLLPFSHLLRSNSLNNLANALSTRFDQKGDLGDLEESIRIHREALDLRPFPHPDRSNSLNNLASVLYTQFQQKGDLGDLGKSIRIHREALDLRPFPHPDRSISLNNLACALSTRFEQKGGDLGDLEESIKFHREALGLLFAPHPLRPSSLSNLANALYTQFGQKGDLGDLEESIRFHREALGLRSLPHPDQSSSLNSLACALSTRFEQRGDFEDLEESIRIHMQVLDLRTVSHPLRSSSLNNLAHALSTRFEQNCHHEDLHQSIRIHREALALLPAPHPLRSSLLNNLASALYLQFQLTKDFGDLEKCVAFCREAADYEFAPVIQRLQISKCWAHRADSHQHPSALEAYESAINLLPHLASLDMGLLQWQEALLQARGLACDAANCAIRNNQMELAVEFLSAGRSVFWTQALHLRTPLDDLASICPELAQRLHSISNTLESASMKDSSKFNSLTSRQKMDIEDQLIQYQKLNDEWIHLLDEVRKIEGFQDFLLPMSFSRLCLCAAKGPVILLNATRLGCDALIITLDGVKHVPLPSMDFSLAVSFEKQLHGFHQCQEVVLQTILEDLWYCIALPIITELGLQKSESPSNRLWWCPTGPFVFLPIHAAGVYVHGKTECVSDYCIPSYSSTLQDLLVPAAPTCSNSFKMLVVIQPEIRGFPNLSLPGTLQELQRIKNHIPQPHEQYLVKLGDESPATVGEVLFHLPSSSIVHFGCHGSYDPAKPLNSGLHLEDGHLRIPEIISCHIPKASLAYLSACETAKGDSSASDEPIHIVAAMIFAGFRGVVGTMWQIHDEDSAEVADIFYRHLFSHGPNPDCTEAAKALHLAVKKLRANNKDISLSHWIPFVHFGI